MKTKQMFLRLHWHERWEGINAGHLLRGAVAQAFPNNNLLHQHDSLGRPIYRYPRVQYRWDKRDGIIVAFGEGIEQLAPLFYPDLQFKLGNQTLHIAESKIEFRQWEIKINNNLIDYYFRSPYLPLNQKNYNIYRAMSPSEREEKLNRLTIGNILISCRELSICFNERIYACFRPRKSLLCAYKDRFFQGFLGTLTTNVELPQDFALGKAVSHGYGWLKRKHPKTGGNTCLN